MNHPYTSQPGGDPPRGFSYEPGSTAPVTGAPYPEGYALPPTAERRPGVVTGAVVLLWVMAGLTLAGSALLVLIVLLSAVQSRGTPPMRAGVVTGIVAALLLVTYAVLMMVSAIRIPKRADSARVLALVLMGFFVFTNLTFIVASLTGFATASGSQLLARNVVGVFLSLVIGTMPAIVIALLSLKKTVTWYYANPIVPPTPQSAFTVPPPPRSSPSPTAG